MRRIMWLLLRQNRCQHARSKENHHLHQRSQHVSAAMKSLSFAQLGLRAPSSIIMITTSFRIPPHTARHPRASLPLSTRVLSPPPLSTPSTPVLNDACFVFNFFASPPQCNIDSWGAGGHCIVFTTHAHQRQLQPLAPRPPEHHRLPHVRSLCLQEQRQSPSASAAATHSIVFIITLLASSHATNIGMINIVDFVIAVTNVVAAACAVATRCYSSFVTSGVPEDPQRGSPSICFAGGLFRDGCG